VASEFAEQIDRPALSVVIPTRNRGDVIRRSVESALRSPRADLEVVLVDDGSADDTESRISQLADRRFHFHRLESEGNANRARNVGARLSRGSLIAFLDSDDVFGPNRIDRLIGYFSRWPKVDCLVDGYVEVSHGTNRIHRMPHSTPSSDEIQHMLLAHLIPLTNSAITIRRAAFDDVDGYDEAMPRHQDREFLLRVARAHSIWFGDDTDIEKYRAEGSISHKYDGYIAGLDALVARYSDYHLPENSQIFRYLIVRGIIKAIVTGHWPAALRELRQWRCAEHLPKDYIRCFRAYRHGARQRSMARADD
jgi:glycosyltransferase involved in cell wall biosynthesis